MKKVFTTIALVAGMVTAAEAQTTKEEAKADNGAKVEVKAEADSAATGEKKKTRVGKFLQSKKEQLAKEWKTVTGVPDTTAAADTTNKKTPDPKAADPKAKVKSGAKDEKKKSATPMIDAIGEGAKKIIPKLKKN